MSTIDFIAGEEHEVMAVLAYRLWEKRGCPLGSPEVDWFEAKNQVATALAKSEAAIALSAVGMEPDEGRWRSRQD
jgi:hypothetical protein